MATFQVSNKKKTQKSGKNVKKIWGITLLALATIIFLFSVTRLVAPLQYFLLGTFGIFVYPMSILMMIIGLALLNNKRYVMPKRYAIFLTLSIIFLITIIQLIILREPANMTFGQYLGQSYTKQWTAGGIIAGFIVTCLVMPIGTWGAGIILSLAFVVSLAFFIESLLKVMKVQQPKSQVRIQIKEKEKKPKQKPIEVKERHQEPNIMLGGNIQEELTKEQIAKQKLGLLGGNKNIYDDYEIKEEKPKNKIPEGMTMREYLLSPPTVDMNSFISKKPPKRQSYTSSQVPNATNAEINRAFNEIKNQDPIKPSQFVHEEEYDFSQNTPVKRGNLPEVKPEQITSEAEDIIRSVVEEERLQMGIDDLATADYIEYPENDEADIAINEFESKKNFDRLERSERSDRFDRTIDRSDRSFDRTTQPNPTSRDSFARPDRSQTQNFDRNFDRNSDRNTEKFDQNQTSQLQNSDRNLERKKRFVELDGEVSEEKETNKPYRYSRPSLDLITTQSDDLSMFNEEIPMKRVALENALEKFGVPAKVQSVVIGPTVTRYEIAMPEGISVKRILSLDADIAYALSAQGQIRIEAPIPGRSIVGIEVPNSKVAKVSIKDVLQSKEFSMSPSPLTFALGKDIAGAVKICNLQKMPHLLVAGTTGSGKSVCLNTIIVSILYKAAPDEVKFIMIDPKQVELSMYEGLPHLVVPKVITDANKAVNALQWAVDEMERRFNLISEARVRNIGEYNQMDDVKSGKKKKMPYLVIIFDEFADFMVEHKNEIESKIQRLAQKARAAGIHLILATQRPSTDVVTGTIKANFPARIAFKVASRVDGEVILGSTGAEKLLGWGDMLYKPADSAPARLQGCFIDTPETKDIVNFIIENNDEIIDTDAQNAINGMGKSSGGSGDNDSSMDPLLPQALKICIDNGVASTTMVQRKLSIGYPRAARIVDQMEERGYISSAEGSKQRTVYTTIEEFYQIFGDNYD